MLPTLLLTRPYRQSDRFAERARAALPAHETLIAPVSEVVPLPFDPAVFDGVRGIILTSANAVPMLPALPALPAWCVGPATTAAARAAGLAAIEGGGDAAALIETLMAERPVGPLIHAHGAHLARDLVAALKPHDIEIRAVAVYEAQALDWDQTVRDRLARAERVIAPLFSPRAADGFVRNLSRVQGLNPDAVTPVAISTACAQRLPESLRASALVADRPNADGIMHRLRAAMTDQGSHPGPLA